MRSKLVIATTALVVCSASIEFCRAQNPGTSAPTLPQSSPNSVLKVGNGVTAPHPIYSPDPEYSEEARKKKLQGTCILWLIVDPEGKPQNIKVVRGLGYGLDEKSIERVETWRFKPALKGSTPVAVQINVEITFRIDGGLPPVETTIPQLKERANTGDANAQLQLAQAYFRGSGVARSDSEGYRLLKLAADQGLPEAEFKMGEYVFAHAYRPGDYIAAYMWYAIAQKRKYKHSKEKLKEIAAKMTADDIAEAEKRAQEWKPAK